MLFGAVHRVGAPPRRFTKSRHILGSDHDQISICLQLECASAPQVSQGGVRVLLQEPEIPAIIDQGSLMEIAKKRTGKKRPFGPPIPDEIRKMVARAKLSKSAACWKQYMTALRNFRSKVQEEMIENACWDWNQFRNIKKAGSFLLATRLWS